MEPQTKRILIVDDDQPLLRMLQRSFDRQPYTVHGEPNGERALALLQEEVFDVIITDVMLGKVSGFDILRKAKAISPHTEVIMITGHGTVDSAVHAMKQGAFEYITKPVDIEELHLVVSKACERQQLVAAVHNLRTQVKEFCRLENIVAASPAMQQVVALVKRVAGTSSTVLIEGPSGSGKEVIARAIHTCSPRCDAAFVAINCAALPETLLESELFGYVKGAFTGAHTAKKGLFEEAHGGTIFLDEIGETSPAFQVKLLRVLQENEVRRVGGSQAIPIDVRVLASSNTPIRNLVDAGRFRQDLYFRLKVIPLFIPPLSQRREDIVPLAQFFIDRYCRQNGRAPVRISKEAAAAMQAYNWPGNVRELEHAIERAMILLDGDTLTREDLMLEPAAPAPAEYSYTDMTLADVERLHIERMLIACGWNQAEAARRLGIGYNTLWRKMKTYGIRRSTNTAP
ncbi:MAG: sigma-54 dependent transcriptional regulator [Desulfobacterota bacterium]|nr:sigma-54 dependent transcriptional regulator [Thermodesulfobacteriota bacterium]